MAPFPESESMTIKRLEVAIRKKDMHLLKDGAYKLHEKFHTGHKFEFLTQLEQILQYVKTSDIPTEITDILCPTIEEILNPETVQNSQQQAVVSQKQVISSESQNLIKDEDIKLQGEAYEKYMAQQQNKLKVEERILQEQPKQDFEHFEAPKSTYKISDNALDTFSLSSFAILVGFTVTISTVALAAKISVPVAS